jgi:tetratricopeptide (TPR) repeat protein
MKKLILLLFMTLNFLAFAQNKALADSYFNAGEYNKAIPIYEQLINKKNYNYDAYDKLIKAYQELENYDKAKLVLTKKIANFPRNTAFLIDLGYNYNLQKDSIQAKENYTKAIQSLEKAPIKAFAIARKFIQYQLLDYAIESYQLAMTKNPAMNYELQLARLYGEKGDFEQMFLAYLDLLAKKPQMLASVQRYLGQYVTNNAYDDSNKLLKHLLIKRLQENPITIYNDLLSWIYIQQKEYYKAFVQQKAIYKRTMGSLNQIFQLGKISLENEAYDDALEIFDYIKNEAQRSTDKIKASHYLIKTKIATENVSNEAINTAFQTFFETYGRSDSTLETQLLYGKFLAFNENKLTEATAFLKKTLKKRLNKFQQAKVKLTLADVLVYQSKFNSALIYLSQIEIDIKNDILAQEARYKIAQTSYYKGDFHWAKNQLDVLKSSTSQLIANNAMELSLLISNNTVKDSLKLALKTYAKADLYAFQNKNQEAIALLDELLLKHKGHDIEDEALYKQASLYIKLKKYNKAKENYIKIISINPEDILVDNAYYQLAKLYDTVLEDTEKAKDNYERIILDFPSSIYYVNAQKRYRILRGDKLN